MFDDYFKNAIATRDRLYHNYLGINKKEFPKWQGWKIIAKYKEIGVDVKNINDNVLDIHVRNFYYLKYIQEL